MVLEKKDLDSYLTEMELMWLVGRKRVACFEMLDGCILAPGQVTPQN